MIRKPNSITVNYPWYAQEALAQCLLALFGQKENVNVYFSGKRQSSLHPTRHNDLFSHDNLFLGKLKDKLAKKGWVNTERVYRIVLISPEHPIMLLKSN